VLAPAGVQFGHRHPVALPVVAFAQPPVMQDGDRRTCEGNGRCLGGAGQVGAEHRGDLIAAAAASQFAGLHLAPLRQLAGQPAGGAPLLVVHGGGVGLKDQLDSHRANVSRSTI
jgi:hypothetical protein